MIEIVAEHRATLADLFAGSQVGGNMADAVLDGYMGRALADSENPTFGILELPKVQIAILSGDFTHPSIPDYLKNLSGIWALFVASDDFARLTQSIHRGKWVELTRYAFSSENLNITELQHFKTQLPAGFQVKKIDTALAKQLAENKDNRFADQHGKNFDSPEDFAERGIGYCVCEGETIACVVSCFAISDTGIEIQIDTKRNYRGRNLATVAAAHLIIHCLENNLDPGWDAATKISAKLAEKLGYTSLGTYNMYVFTDSRLLVILRDVVRGIKKLLGKERLLPQ